jgi:hypothetical protein
MPKVTRPLFLALALLAALATFAPPAQAQSNIKYRFYAWADMDADNIQDTGNIDYCKRQSRVLLVTGLGNISPQIQFTVTLSSASDMLVLTTSQWVTCKATSTGLYYLPPNYPFQIEMPDVSSDISYFTSGSDTLFEHHAGFRLW